MKTRKIYLAIMVVLGIWHGALASSPGGEEKGGKSTDKAEFVSKSAAPGQNLAAMALDEGTDMVSPTSAESVANTASTTSSKSTSMQSIVSQRKHTQLSSMERASARKSLKSALKSHKKADHGVDSPQSPMADDMMIICVILCFFIPPLAVYLWENSIGINFWISLILTLLFWLPGVIFSLIVVLTT
jgi:uncharacterized membrane protein YqaE (UPF0057 family)